MKRRVSPVQFHLRDLLVLTAGIALFLGVLIPLIRASREHARRAQCCNNLRQIGLALHNHHDCYKKFPIAQVADTGGRPIHSWRIALMPFVESNPYFDMYRANNVPWDHPSLTKLHGVTVRTYGCPSDDTRSRTQDTSYLVIQGADTLWPPSACVSFGDVKDGSSHTIAFVETIESGIHWLEPRDLGVEHINLGINPSSARGIASQHPGGANVCLVDGSTRFLAQDMAPKTLQALVTIRGNEDVSLEDDP